MAEFKCATTLQVAIGLARGSNIRRPSANFRPPARYREIGLLSKKMVIREKIRPTSGPKPECLIHIRGMV
jgi:hypothetical protein